MPTYEYECTKCGCLFELFQPMTEKPKKFMATDCDECQNKAPVIRRIGTGGAVIFKGGGFYQTDYRSESYKEAVKKETESTSGEKKEVKPADAKPAATEATNASTPRSAKSKKKGRG